MLGPGRPYWDGGVDMTDSEVTQDALDGFDLFRSDTRIAVIECLLEMDGPTTSTELVARMEGYSEPERSLAVDLHHFHLPALDEVGVITYDRETDRVTKFDADRLQTLVDAIQETIDSI